MDLLSRVKWKINNILYEEKENKNKRSSAKLSRYIIIKLDKN